MLGVPPRRSAWHSQNGLSLLDMTDISTTLRARLGLSHPVPMEFRRSDLKQSDGFDRERVEYHGLEGDLIPAFLFRPRNRRPLGGVVVFHQHNGEFHLGKSEVAGEVGDPFQAFGPALARMGLAVLAPDAITFEDRRGAVRGSSRAIAIGFSTTTPWPTGCWMATC